VSEQQAGRLASSQVPAIFPPIGEELRRLTHTPGSSGSRLRRLYADSRIYVSKCHTWERFFHNVKERAPPISFILKQIKNIFSLFSPFPIFSFLT
jgi:hypothetical protein